MIKKIILFISAAGIITSLYLVISDILHPGFCPAYIKIPACYIVLIAFISLFVSCFIKNNIISSTLFYSGTIVGLLLAVWFSYNQLAGLKECPKLLNIPLCYVSLATFIIVLTLKIVEYQKPD